MRQPCSRLRADCCGCPLCRSCLHLLLRGWECQAELRQLQVSCPPQHLGKLTEQADGVTCTDILLALEELPSGGLSAQALQEFCGPAKCLSD